MGIKQNPVPATATRGIGIKDEKNFDLEKLKSACHNFPPGGGGGWMLNDCCSVLPRERDRTGGKNEQLRYDCDYNLRAKNFQLP